MPNGDLLEAYAELVVRVGVNLQPGQRLTINAYVEHVPFVRAVARAGYAAGASFVDPAYSDQHVRREHILHAPDEYLGWSPPWLVQQARAIAEDGGAVLTVSGNPEPEIFADLDGSRVAGARMRELTAARLALTGGAANWCIVGYPSPGWADLVFGEPDVDRLWQAIATCVRLDEPDPIAAWRDHIATLDR